MTAKINWSQVEEDNKPNYKQYAPDGEYTTKVESVEVLTASTGNKGLRFNLADTDEHKFPKYGHTFYGFMKESWRQYHMKHCFIALGFTESQAEKAVEQCDDAKDVAEAYKAMFDKALAKQKPFKVVVFKEYTDDQYSTWDFAYDKARMAYPKNTTKSKKTIENETVPIDDPMAGAEEVDLSDEQLPF